MRSICVLLSALTACGVLSAQAARTNYRQDVNGQRVAVANSQSSDGTTTQRAMSINGREVPIEQREERVIREDARGKVTEVTITRYSRDGKPVKTERIVTESTIGARGAISTEETYYETNGSGRMQEIERRSIQQREVRSSQGPRVETETTVERVDLNGAFRPAERIREVTTGPEGNSSTSTTVSRIGVNNRYQESQRTVTTTVVNDGQATTNSAVYRPGPTGKMDMMEQAVTVVTRRDDGTTVTDVSQYRAAPPGRLNPSGSQPQLVEQQRTEQRIQSDGSVLETVQLRQPTISDPNRLGNPRLIAETVCRGECIEPLPAEPAPAPATETVLAQGDGETGVGVQTPGTLPAAVTPDPSVAIGAPGTTATAGISTPDATAAEPGTVIEITPAGGAAVSREQAEQGDSGESSVPETQNPVVF